MGILSLGMGITHYDKEKDLNMCDLFRSKMRSHNKLIQRVFNSWLHLFVLK